MNERFYTRSMSRSFKFRVWDGEKFYHTINDVHVYPRGFSDNFGLSFEITPNERLPYSKQSSSRLVEIDIQQYTGHNDKKGKEIYEGDIVKYHYVSPYGNSEWIVKGVVEWNAAETGYRIVYHDTQDAERIEYYPLISEKIEVVANIHQTKETTKL